jgi:hypothetical protein
MRFCKTTPCIEKYDQDINGMTLTIFGTLAADLETRRGSMIANCQRT